MNSKKAKRLRRLISHLDEERCIKYIKSGVSRHAIWKKDGSVDVEERGTAQAVANLKRHIYQRMKQYADEPDVLIPMIKELEKQLAIQAEEEFNQTSKRSQPKETNNV